MKTIDLLNKIAKGEEVPHFIIDEQEYYVGADGYLKEVFGDDVEWTLDYEWLNQKVEIIEEEKEIEKLKIEQDNSSSNYYIRNEYGTKCALTKHSKMIAEKVNELIDEINKLKENK